MRILVTGANGLLGQKLVEYLAKDDSLEVIATGRGVNRVALGKYQYISSDLTNPAEVKSLISASKPDNIIHCAAMTQVDECEADKEACWAANVTATELLLKEARLSSCHFLYLSTDFVFDGEEGPYQESDQPNPISYYGKSKWEAEKLVQSSGLPWAIVRTVLVYGITPHMSRSNIVLWVKENLEEKKPIKVVTDQIRTPTLVEDLAFGCAEVSRRGLSGIFHLSGPDVLSPYQMAIEVANFYSLDKSLITPVDASTFTQLGKRPPRTGFVIEKAKKTLNYQPKSFPEGIRVIKDQLGNLKSNK
ncbi:MAG: dTDP-4-dehydrorhamnose reductase [Marinoscillum sp.]|jgi:dTDP-4-dehydrorhamnose reductase